MSAQIDYFVVVRGCERWGRSRKAHHLSLIPSTLLGSFDSIYRGEGSYGGWWIPGSHIHCCQALFHSRHTLDEFVHDRFIQLRLHAWWWPSQSVSGVRQPSWQAEAHMRACSSAVSQPTTPQWLRHKVTFIWYPSSWRAAWEFWMSLSSAFLRWFAVSRVEGRKG